MAVGRMFKKNNLSPGGGKTERQILWFDRGEAREWSGHPGDNKVRLQKLKTSCALLMIKKEVKES